jgi:pimeloyl-ACP methyl ester carboxylesterase
MTALGTRQLTLRSGVRVQVDEIGTGPALLYLHGFADLHSASVGWLPFHERLAESFRVIAPAHPGCAGSDEDERIDTIDDVAFHYLEVLDALGLDRVDLVGTCIGGWIAAELAVRHCERIDRLVLIGASGLYVPNEPIGDLFWEVQAQNGVEYPGLRRLLFAHGEGALARTMFPDGRDDPDREVSRYKAMRFASRVGFKPPYFYHRNLRARLPRCDRPALLIWGDIDRMVPRAHAEAYRAGLVDASVQIIADAGHSPQLEQPAQTAAAIRAFLAQRKSAPAPAAPKKARARAKSPTTKRTPAKVKTRAPAKVPGKAARRAPKKRPSKTAARRSRR